MEDLPPMYDTDQIFTIQPSGSGVTQLTDVEENLDPSYSADGENRLFARPCRRARRGHLDHEPRRLGPDADHQRPGLPGHRPRYRPTAPGSSSSATSPAMTRSSS